VYLGKDDLIGDMMIVYVAGNGGNQAFPEMTGHLRWSFLNCLGICRKSKGKY
jgi:hypothetical protein